MSKINELSVLIITTALKHLEYLINLSSYLDLELNIVQLKEMKDNLDALLEVALMDN